MGGAGIGVQEKLVQNEDSERKCVHVERGGYSEEIRDTNHDVFLGRGK